MSNKRLNTFFQQPKKIIERTTSALLSVVMLVSTSISGISTVSALSNITAGDTFKVSLADYVKHGGNTDIGVEDSNDVTRPNGKHNSNTDDTSWFEYNLSVEADTTYKMLARVASPAIAQDSNAGSPYLRLYLDGKNESNRIATVHHGRTGGWLTWEDTNAIDVKLPQGNHTLRVEFGAKFNASELRFEKKTDGVTINNSNSVTHTIGNEIYKIDAISANMGYSPLQSADKISSDFFVGGDSNDLQGQSKYPLNTVAATKLVYAVKSQKSAKYQLKARLRAERAGTLYVDTGKTYIAIPYTATNGQWLTFEGEGALELINDVKTDLTVSFSDKVDLNYISVLNNGIILPEQNGKKKFIAAQDAVSFKIQGSTSDFKTVARPDQDNSAKADKIPAVVKGDSLSFEVDAPEDYEYFLSARLGGGGANNISMKTPAIGIYLDGSDKKVCTITGRGQINEVAPWVTATTSNAIKLTKGKHTITVVFEEDCYLNWIAFKKESDAVSIGDNKVINAVDCSDSNKTFDYDTGFNPPTDNPGGKIFCDTVKGTWLEYKISVDSAAEYEFTALVAGNSNQGDFIQMDVYLDDEKVGGTVQNKTGDWYNWTESTRVGLKLTGEHVVRVEFGSQHNLYQIKFKKRPKGAGKVTSVTIVGEETLKVPQGEGVSFAANVKGTGEYDPFVVWSVSDENDQPVSSKIEENGFLRIALTEKAKKLKVVATARTPETDAKGDAIAGADPVVSAPVIINVTASGDSGAAVAKDIAKEGMVLLKNENNVLPIKKGETGKIPHVALLGLGQVHYIKGGEGSGEVYSPYQRTLIDGMKIMQEKGSVTIDSGLLNYYEKLPAMPINRNGMNTPEPPMTDIQPLMNAAIAKDEDSVAIVTLRRLSGEGWDININNDGAKNGYYLSNDEKELITSALNTFKKVVVVLNIGVVIDTNWLVNAKGTNGEKIDSLLLTWQPGIEGGVAMAEILCGEVNPSGKLSDTFATSYDAYPSSKTYSRSNIAYEEDIFVGYRYFETMAKEDVVFPFGYGLSYTDFAIKTNKVTNDGKNIDVSVTVENTGTTAGKEVVQVYYSAPKGKLPQPAKELAAFKKTKLLQPGEKETIHLTFAIKDMASFDDVGKTGKESAWVLEEGSYRIYVGNSVRNTVETDSYVVEKITVVEQLEKKLQPKTKFGYKKLSRRLDGTGKNSFENNVWKSESSFFKTLYKMLRIESASKMKIPDFNQSGNLQDKLMFSDVVKSPDKMSDFISQLSNYDLLKLSFGTGYAWNEIEDASLKGPDNIIDGANTACTWDLPEFGIPRAQTADGPAGIRSNTKKTTAFPNATLQACTWNPDLVLKGGAAGAREAKNFSFKQPQFSELSTIPGYSIWLTPGMNIHRDPQCGRNFEYYSEDPYLTGVMAIAQVQGIQSENVAATAKHFAANNIEENRKGSNSMMSERALREIYLKGFEMLVKSDSQPWCIMSSYNVINGVKASESEELLTDILRKEWGFKGLVMSDWSNCGDLATEIIAGEALKMPGAGEMRNEWDEAGNPNFDPTGGRSDGPEYQQAIKAINKGDLPRTVIEDNIRSLLHLLSRTFLYDGEGQKASYNQVVPVNTVDAKAQYTHYYENEKVRVYAPGVKDLVVLDDNGAEIAVTADVSNKWWYTFNMPSSKVTLSTRSYIDGGNVDDDAEHPLTGDKIAMGLFTSAILSLLAVVALNKKRYGYMQ